MFDFKKVAKDIAINKIVVTPRSFTEYKALVSMCLMNNFYWRGGEEIAGWTKFYDRYDNKISVKMCNDGKLEYSETEWYKTHEHISITFNEFIRVLCGEETLDKLKAIKQFDEDELERELARRKCR